MENNNDKDFILTRGEYAQKINKSKGSVIQSMRRGGLRDLYIFKEGKYLFIDPKAMRANTNSIHKQTFTAKKKYNRGNHFKAAYPNQAFKQHNELKMLAKLKHGIDDKKADKIPEAIKLIEQQEREKKQKSLLQSPTKYYGGMLSNQQLNREKFTATNRGRSTKKKTYY